MWLCRAEFCRRAGQEPQLQRCSGFRSDTGAVPLQLRAAGGTRGCRRVSRARLGSRGSPKAGGAGSPPASSGPYQPGTCRAARGAAGSPQGPAAGGAEPPLPPRAPHGDLPAAGAGRRRRTDSSSGQSALGAARGAPPLQPRGPITAAPAGRGAGLPRPGRRFCVCERCAVPAPRGRRRLGGPARPDPAGSADRRRRRGLPSPAVVGGPRGGGGVPPRAR